MIRLAGGGRNSGVRQCPSRSVVLTARGLSTLPNQRSGKQFPVPDVISRSRFRTRPRCPQVRPSNAPAPWTDGAGDHRAEASPVQLPPSMPPMPDGPTPDDPLAILHSESATPSPSPPPAMPPLPEGNHLSTPDETDVLLARYRSQVKPRGEEIRKRIAQALMPSRREHGVKLRHDVSSLWTAVNSQLENLGTLAITHRPPTVNISSEVAELSQIQRELSEHQVTIDSLRQGTGGRSVVKQIEGEVARLRDRQREAVIAIGRKVALARPDMPSAAGTYSALDRVQSSLTAAEAELAGIEKEIGPSGLVGALSFGEAGTVGKITSPSAFAFALFLFFLPWLTVSCQNQNGRGNQGLEPVWPANLLRGRIV